MAVGGSVGVGGCGVAVGGSVGEAILPPSSLSSPLSTGDGKTVIIREGVNVGVRVGVWVKVGVGVGSGIKPSSRK